MVMLRNRIGLGKIFRLDLLEKLLMAGKICLITFELQEGYVEIYLNFTRFLFINFLSLFLWKTFLNLSHDSKNILN